MRDPRYEIPIPVAFPNCKRTIPLNSLNENME